MIDYLIRFARREDALNFTALSLQVWLDTYATEGLRDELSRFVLREFTVETSERTITDAEQRVLVVEMNGHLVGYIQARRRSAIHLVESTEQAEIFRVYVQEPFTRRGIGRAMMTEMEKLLCDDGAEVVWLTAWVGNMRARAFYPQTGYTDIGSVDWVEEGESYENRVFMKRL